MAKEEKKAQELPKFVMGKSEPALAFGSEVVVKATEESGLVTGIVFEQTEDTGLLWVYRVGSGWFSSDQLETK
jgi:hypothetical protein